MFILSTVPLSEEHVERIRRVAPEAEVAVLPHRQASAGELDRAFERAEIAFLFGGELTASRLRRATRLRWIQAAYAGVDRLLEAAPELRRHPALLTNARGMHAATIADHVFMFMLAWARRLPAYLDQQRRHEWKRQPVRELAGETLTVVGLGAIGREVARRALAFGMRVMGVRRRPEPVPGVDPVVTPDQLRRVLAPAQWVVVSAALTPETRHLIGAAELAAMRRDAFLINVSRGAVVDEQALIRALRDGTIAGAGLDVFADEPLPPGHPFWDMDNVLITPHIAGNMRDYIGRAVDLFTENLARFLRGEPLLNQVDKELGY
ncbi:MAG TPA: D-2-hydroxyacid dehydrogenase [Thermaerobacter sp.]